MKKYSTLLGAAVLGLSATASYATVTLNITTVAINAALETGWNGYVLTLTTSGASTGVSGFDFTNDFNNGIVSISGNIGIHGNLQQSWTLPFAGGGAVATGTATAIPGTNGLRDSAWLSGAGTGNAQGFLSNPDDAVEDNNLLNGSNPPWTQSPMADKAAVSSTSTNGFNNGVGTFMTYSGAYKTPLTGTTTLAFIIVPDPVVSGLSTVIRGTVQDQASAAFIVDTTIGAVAPIPEPASLGLLALGGLGLLARRRRA